MVELERVKMQRTSTQANSIDLDLSPMLSKHRFGGFIVAERYKALESKFFLLNFAENKEDIARTLAGAVMPIGSEAILIIKVEVYSRVPSEDPHYFNLVRPSIDVKRVAIIFHDNSNKLIIGTESWSALVTASINLSSGDISVGVNTSVRIVTDTFVKIWGRDDHDSNPLLERQLRSKFDQMATYFQCASIFYPFIHWSCHPCTIFNLRNYYGGNKAMSGMKATSIIFNEIQASKEKRLKKSTLVNLLKDKKLEEAPKTKKAIEMLVLLFPARSTHLELVETPEASSHLRILADSLCDAIRNNNINNVCINIKRVIDDTIQGRQA
ncbi:hypothetical protein BGZ49_002279 [Haplosporangium sp. Z 27]|nr:hypothetical protein BGZ49_002279 [Haplosporangium sp. Z 27]